MTLKDLNVGDTFINSYGNITTIEKICIKSNDIYLKSEHGTNWICSAGGFISRVKNGKYTDYTPVKQWKIGDYVTANLCLGRKAYSNDFIGKIVKFYNNEGLSIQIIEGTFTSLIGNIIHKKGHVLNNMTFKGNDFKLINYNNNEKNGKIITRERREISGQPITSNCTREITSASRLIGNPISNRVKETRVGGFKISPNAISA